MQKEMQNVGDDTTDSQRRRNEQVPDLLPASLPAFSVGACRNMADFGGFCDRARYTKTGRTFL